MQAYRIETTVEKDGTLTLKDLPLHAGESIEVIILLRPFSEQQQKHYPLRGTAVTYLHPTDPVAQEDWEAIR
ncbi:MAG: hypothetical protein HYZ50_08030 [Deltaproteobacteria bacterium]|nr:hypothetical protein [Deltaproteobacteria bacterium]